MEIDQKLRKEKVAEIAEYIRAARDALSMAEAVADKYSLEFYWEGPAYGMGGYYSGKSATTDDDDGWNSSDEEGWQASSQSC